MINVIILSVLEPVADDNGYQIFLIKVSNEVSMCKTDIVKCHSQPHFERDSENVDEIGINVKEYQ